MFIYVRVFSDTIVCFMHIDLKPCVKSVMEGYWVNYAKTNPKHSNQNNGQNIFRSQDFEEIEKCYSHRKKR